MTLHNYATPPFTILLTRANGSVDGRNLAMSGKAARQTVAHSASGAAVRVAGSAGAAGAAARAMHLAAGDAQLQATSLAAGSELGDELLQKVNSNLEAWHGNKLAHGVSVVSAGSNVGARQSAEGELSAICAATSSNRHGLNTNLTVCLECVIN